MSVFYNVPLIPQEANRTCWYACAQMIVRYHRDQAQATTIAGMEVDQPEVTAQIRSVNVGLLPRLAEQVARATHLRMEFVSPTPDRLQDLLTRFGPLWYGGNVRGYRSVGSGAHVVVLTGIRRDVSGNEVLINDPWPVGGGARLAYEYDEFFSKLQAVPEVPILHI